MRLGDAARTALRELRRNTLRSALTALGIIIGVATFVVMVSLGKGATVRVQEEVARLGQNVLLVERASGRRSAVRVGQEVTHPLSEEDARAIADEVASVVAVSPEVYISGQISAGGKTWKTKIRGEGADYFALREWPLAEGELFTAADVDRAVLVAVLGRTAAREIFGDDSPVGVTLRVNQVPFRVTGVLQPKGISLEGSDEDNVVFVPFTSALRRLVGKETKLHRINVQAADAEALHDVEAEITKVLRRLHRIGPGQPDDFQVRSQVEIEDLATTASRTMTVLLAALASVSLFVGGIGIMNIMLVSVTERTREIGIRLAVGAHPRDVLGQFLVEALSLSVAGGAVGILAGILVSNALSVVVGWPAVVSAESTMVAFFFSAGVGVFFGFYPARKASRLDPIEALHRQ